MLKPSVQHDSPSPLPTPPGKEGVNTREAMLRIARDYLKPYIGLIILALLANVVVSMTTVSVPLIIEAASTQLSAFSVDGAQTMPDTRDSTPPAQEKTSLSANSAVTLVKSKALGTVKAYMPDLSGIFLLPAFAALIMLLKALASYASSVILASVGQKMVAAVQTRLFGRIAIADLSWIQQTHSGRLISVFMTDAVKLRDTMNQTIVNLSRHLLEVIGLSMVLFFMDWRMALIACAGLPFVVFNTRRLGRRTRKATRQGLERTSDLSMVVSETIKGIRVVKAYNQEKYQIAQATKTIARMMENMLRSLRARAAASPATEALTGLGFAGVLVYAMYQGQAGLMTIGDLTGFIAALMLTYQPLKAVASLSTVLQDGVAACQRIFPLLDMQPLITDTPEATTLKVSKGNLELEHVHFTYKDGTQALDDISLFIPAGTTAALVGPSGGGKSTALNLVPRFYDVTAGRVLVDGQDVRNVTLDSLRRASSLVTQEPFLFDDTIEANIAYGSPNASTDAIRQAARMAEAHQFISGLKNGYETRVGEAGTNLSGGQRQRIAIARAILKDAPVLLLDEATSSLDSVSEKLVQGALQTLMTGRTTLVIAHRLSTIMHADHIYVMEKGRIVEQGIHQDLLDQNGLYATLFRTQFEKNGTESPSPTTEHAARLPG